MEGHGNERTDGASDEELMAAWGAGDAGAFRELFGRWTPRLFSFFLAMNRDRADAQDLVQETWVRVFRSRERFDPARKFRPWVFRIAARLQSDLLRSWNWRIRTLAVSPSGPEDAPGPDPLDRVPAPAIGPEGAAADAERAGKLRRALGSLREPHRKAIVLHDLERMTCREIAETLDAPVATVLSWLHRGRMELRALLEAEGGKGAWT